MTAFSEPPRRFLYLQLDRLPTDRLRRARTKAGRKVRTNAPPRPFALTIRQGNAVRLYALTAAAEAAGLMAGMSLSDAKAQIPDLKTLEADPAADAALLEAIAEACRRYTPALAVDAPDGVFLNVTGTERLFGGEDGLVADLSARLTEQGLSFRHGIADTPGLAWALARFGTQPVAGVGEREDALAPLPMSALRLEPEAVEVLAGLGLKRVGHLFKQPRAPLARRLGPAALDRLDEVLGRRASALMLKLEIPPWCVETRLAEPISSEDQVLQVARDLAAKLSERLEGEGLGGRSFALELFRLDGAVKRLEVGTSRPLRAPAKVAALFAERLASLNEGLEADFGFEQARLWARAVQPFKATADDLVDGVGSEEALAVLADRLSARLGAGAVKRLVPARETRLPERAVKAEPYAAAAAAWTQEPPAVDEGAPLRPLTLFAQPQPIEVTAGVPEDPPRRFVWRRLARTVVAAEGPERLEPEWGRTTESRVRDYYRLEDAQGRRYWVYREGRFGETPQARWFLHGLFA
jgi:protein ImuB